MRTAPWRLLTYRPLRIGILVQAPLIFVSFYLWLIAARTHWQLQDFAAVRSAAHSVLRGVSPYPPADPAVVVQAKQLVYPPLVAYLFAPFALLPYHLSALLYLGLALVSIVLALRMLGVTDWRCYTVIGLWYPLASSLAFGTLGPLLLLLIALAWRHRDARLVPPLALAVAIVAKLFLWPVIVWYAATRRWRGTFLTAIVAAVAFLVPFAPLGVHTLKDYPRLLHVLDAVFGPTSLATNAFVVALGASQMVADALAVLLGVVLIAGTFVLGRTGREGAALSLATTAALFLSPIVWVHYYVLLIVPLALLRPRLAAAWFVPVLYWIEPLRNNELWHAGTGVGVTILVLIAAAPPRARLVALAASVHARSPSPEPAAAPR